MLIRISVVNKLFNQHKQKKRISESDQEDECLVVVSWLMSPDPFSLLTEFIKLTWRWSWLCRGMYRSMWCPSFPYSPGFFSHWFEFFVSALIQSHMFCKCFNPCFPRVFLVRFCVHRYLYIICWMILLVYLWTEYIKTE